MSETPTPPAEAIALADYLGVKDPAAVEDVHETAVSLVDAHIAGYALDAGTIPKPAYNRAVLEVGADLYNRKAAKNGVAQFGVMGEQSPIRINRDPLAAARPILAPYLTKGGFA